MRVSPIRNIYDPSKDPSNDMGFRGYPSKLKKLYKAHKLPQIKYGFYGDKLSITNCSIEHLKPVSKGGVSDFSNMVLASNDKNCLRGDKPLIDFIDFKAMAKYLEQFKNIDVDGFNGNNYIAQIFKRVGECLQKGL